MAGVERFEAKDIQRRLSCIAKDIAVVANLPPAVEDHAASTPEPLAAGSLFGLCCCRACRG